MANSTGAQRERALKLAERLLEIAPDVGEETLAKQLHSRLQRPMAEILAKVPGDSLTERAKAIGITRQCYYAWLKGVYRPHLKQAKKLARLTGLDLADIYWKA